MILTKKSIEKSGNSLFRCFPSKNRGSQSRINFNGRQLNTVKPELTITSEYRPPFNNDHHFKVPFQTFTISMTSEQQPPDNDSHYWVPGVVVVHSFDCI